MKPIDYRNETWESLQERLSGLRQSVYQAWQAYGPGTTREVAQKAGIDILTFRPRTTELFQMGFVEVVDDAESVGEAVYQAVWVMTVRDRFHASQQSASCQKELQLT
jgi:hypothetical protein